MLDLIVDFEALDVPYDHDSRQVLGLPPQRDRRSSHEHEDGVWVHGVELLEEAGLHTGHGLGGGEGG